MSSFIKIPFMDLPERFFSTKLTSHSFNKGCELWLEDEKDISNKLLNLKIFSPRQQAKPSQIQISKVTRQLNIKLNIQGSLLSFDTGCQGNWDIRLWPESELSVGEGSTANSARIITDSFCSVRIGSDCMLSENVLVECGDKHAIFSLIDEKQLNHEPSSILLGNHCWLGRDSAIIASSKRLELGAGSILGAKSVLTQSVERFSLAVGCPAKVVKEQVSWSRDKKVSNIKIQKIKTDINHASA